MSRAKIGAACALIVAVLTAAAYFLATSRLDSQVADDVETRVARAKKLFAQIGALESLDLIRHAQELAHDETMVKALAAAGPDERKALGDQGIRRFLGGLDKTPRPDFTALVDKNGAVVKADTPLPDSDDLKTKFKALAAAIDGGQVSKDVWQWGNSVFKVGVAPVVDPSGARPGAVVLGYALSNKEAQEHAAQLGVDVVFYAGDRLVASSFAKSVVGDLKSVPALAKLASDGLAGGKTTPITVDLGGDTWVADAGPLPLNFSDRQAGAIVFESLSRALGRVSSVTTTILLLGVAALVVALLTMVVTARLILHQSEEIELGVTEIINGDADYQFHPVGADLDGLASALNVMLARLLGRPEPGEETLEDAPGKVLLDDDVAIPSGVRMSNDPEIVALASEPEAQYYRRIFDEYLAARKAAGESVESITSESFTAKLRLNEANLKKKYNCKGIRFRVVTKDGKVTLKPVPIV